MRSRGSFLLCAALVAGLGGWIRSGVSQDGKPPRPPGGGDDFGLVAGLKDVEGCLGVETAQTSSGKSVIFAWFKDLDAALDW